MQDLQKILNTCCQQNNTSVIVCTNNSFFIYHDVLMQPNQEITYSMIDILYIVCSIQSLTNMINITRRREQLAISKMFTMNFILFTYTTSNYYLDFD